MHIQLENEKMDEYFGRWILWRQNIISLRQVME